MGWNGSSPFLVLLELWSCSGTELQSGKVGNAPWDVEQGEVCLGEQVIDPQWLNVTRVLQALALFWLLHFDSAFKIAVV